MRLHHTLITLSLITALFASAAAQEKSPDANPPVIADPMAGFARLVGGEWQVTFASGEKGYQAWQWGPGKYSLRKMAYATGTAGNPWGGEVMYWHPGRKLVWVLSMHEDIPAVGRGVGEGTIKFEGDTADGVMELHQPRGPRKLGTRWVFDGPDKYRDTLLEDTGAGLKPMNGWDFVRVKERPKAPAKASEAGPAKLPPHLKVFESLLGRTWEAQSASANAFHIQTTFGFIPSLEVINARVVAPNKDGEPTPLLDAYFYHHLGTKTLRCLALSNRGGVYEGNWIVDGEALQLDLKGFEGDRVIPHVVRLDFVKDKTMRQRVWSLKGTERTLLLDVHHTKLEPSENRTQSKNDSTPAKGETVTEMPKDLWYVFQDKNGHHWFGSRSEGAFRYDGKTITRFTSKDGLAGVSMGGIQEDKSGNLYFTTDKGVSKFDGRSFTTLEPQAAGEWKKEADDLWFCGGQDSGVVYRYDGKSLHRLAFPKTKAGDAATLPRDKFPNAKYSPYDVYTIFKDSKGHLWFGTAVLGACRYDGKSFTWIPEEELRNDNFGLRSIIEDKDGRFWFSNTLHRYVVDLPADASQRYRKEKGIGDLSGHKQDEYSHFMSSTLGDDGTMWMAILGGVVYRYDGKSMTRYPVTENGKHHRIFSIYKDRQGVLWLGTQAHGAYRFNGKSFEKFRP